MFFLVAAWMTLRAISATSRWFRRERHPSVNPPNLDVSSSLSLVKVSFKSSSFLGARSSIPERNIHAMSADSFSKTYLPTAGIHKSGRSAVAARVALNARRSWSRVIWSPTDSFFFAFFFSTSSFTSVSESSFGGRRRLNRRRKPRGRPGRPRRRCRERFFRLWRRGSARRLRPRLRLEIPTIYLRFGFLLFRIRFCRRILPQNSDDVDHICCFCCYKRRLRPTS